MLGKELRCWARNLDDGRFCGEENLWNKSVSVDGVHREGGGGNRSRLFKKKKKGSPLSPPSQFSGHARFFFFFFFLNIPPRETLFLTTSEVQRL